LLGFNQEKKYNNFSNAGELSWACESEGNDQG
jgi:hypothetical protein